MTLTAKRLKYIFLIVFCCSSQLALQAQEILTQHLIAAREYMRAGKLPQARAELDSALLISPKNPQVNALLGDLYYQQEIPLKALLYYDKAITYGLQDASLYYKRARLHTELNNHPAYVIKDYDQAISLAPDSLTYYLDKAKYLAGHINPATQKPYFAEAVNTINQALKRFPDNHYLYYLRSQYLFGAGRTLSALGDIDKAIKMAPDKAEYLAQRGYINFMIGNYKAAYTSYSQAIRLDPGKAEYYEFRGHSLQNLDRYEQAYDDYSKAIDLVIARITTNRKRLSKDDPLNKQLRILLLYRGISLVHANRPYDGCQDFERAYRMGEDKARNYMRQYCN